MNKFLTVTYLAGVLVSAPLLSDIRTPEQLSSWMQNNLVYQQEVLTDNWKLPQQTILDEGGDCEDFAILTQAVLSDLKIESQLIYIRYSLLESRHVICIYETFGGTYNVFDNQYLYKTPYKTRREILNQLYPKWRSSGICDEKKNCNTWIYKN